jgi:hypothetical protein
MHDRLCFVTVHMNCTAIWETCQILRGRNVGACLAGESVTKTVALLGESRAAISKVMMAYTNHEKTSSANRNSGQKPKISERDCCTLQKILSNNQ